MARDWTIHNLPQWIYKTKNPLPPEILSLLAAKFNEKDVAHQPSLSGGRLPSVMQSDYRQQDGTLPRQGNVPMGDTPLRSMQSPASQQPGVPVGGWPSQSTNEVDPSALEARNNPAVASLTAGLIKQSEQFERWDEKQNRWRRPADPSYRPNQIAQAVFIDRIGMLRKLLDGLGSENTRQALEIIKRAGGVAHLSESDVDVINTLMGRDK